MYKPLASAVTEVTEPEDGQEPHPPACLYPNQPDGTYCRPMYDLAPPVLVFVIKVSSEAPKVTDYWSTAIAASALIIATVAAWANWQTNKNQAKQLKKLEADEENRRDQERRQQASRVWFRISSNHVVNLRNESGLPIFDIEVWRNEEHGGKTRLAVLDYNDPADRHVPMPATRNKLQMLAKAKLQNSGVAPATQEHADLLASTMDSLKRDGIYVTFRDASNVRWLRLPDGILNVLEPVDP